MYSLLPKISKSVIFAPNTNLQIMTVKIKLLSFALPLLLCSCKSGSTAPQQEKNASQDTIQAFALPEIPAMLTTPEQRADFLVNHYWDNVSFADTAFLHNKEVSEQAWADYCNIMNHVPRETAQKAIKEMIKKTEENRRMFDYFTEMADKYLYDPNSPMRNEEFYIPVLEALIASPVLNDTEKIRPQARLELAHKNRPGTKALNFTYTLASGATGTLHGCSAEYTLLFLNNPGCHACAETIAGLKASPIISGWVAEKKLKILAVYPDEELTEWQKHRYEFPDEWINGYDKTQSIKMKNLYDLKAIPTLYLLDKNKIVLLKDALLPVIEQYLMQR